MTDSLENLIGKSGHLTVTVDPVSYTHLKIAKRSEKGESKNRPVATNFRISLCSQIVDKLRLTRYRCV